MRSPFDPGFEDLPKVIPIFPLAGVLLLPRGTLPLNIFEPRYLNMTADALRQERVIGMVQPLDPEAQGDNPVVYPTGCAGRLTQFGETDDGRYLITLTGLCRFEIAEELPLHNGYRRVIPRWDAFAADLVEEAEPDIDRDRLVERLRPYFDAQGIDADWEAIAETPDERLVTALAMLCPFEPREKQALLECPTLAERNDAMIALMEMALTDDEGADSVLH
ncbi:MAG: LON peptidase substrate-binding domain-containing protein [Kiloniellales bacterium]